MLNVIFSVFCEACFSSKPIVIAHIAPLPPFFWRSASAYDSGMADSEPRNVLHVIFVSILWGKGHQLMSTKICIYIYTHTINCVLNCVTTQTWSSMPSSRAVERTSTQKSFGRKSVVPTVGIKRFLLFSVAFRNSEISHEILQIFWLTLLVRRWAFAGHAFLYANQWLEVVCLPGFKAGVDGVEHGDLVKAGS